MSIDNTKVDTEDKDPLKTVHYLGRYGARADRTVLLAFLKEGDLAIERHGQDLILEETYVQREPMMNVRQRDASLRIRIAHSDRSCVVQ